MRSRIRKVTNMRDGSVEFVAAPQIRSVVDLRTGLTHANTKGGWLNAMGQIADATREFLADVSEIRFPLSRSRRRRMQARRIWFADGTDLAIREADALFREASIVESCYCDEIGGLCEPCEEAECGCGMPECIWCDPYARDGEIV